MTGMVHNSIVIPSMSFRAESSERGIPLNCHSEHVIPSEVFGARNPYAAGRPVRVEAAAHPSFKNLRNLPNLHNL